MTSTEAKQSLVSNKVFRLKQGNLLPGRLTLDFPSALWVLPTWLPVWILAASLALPLSALVGRGGSHLAGYALLAALLIANDRKKLSQNNFHALSAKNEHKVRSY